MPDIGINAPAGVSIFDTFSESTKGFSRLDFLGDVDSKVSAAVFRFGYFGIGIFWLHKLVDLLAFETVVAHGKLNIHGLTNGCLKRGGNFNSKDLAKENPATLTNKRFHAIWHNTREDVGCDLH